MHELTIFGLERLEDRLLLAVNVHQSGSTLTISGDADDNVVGVFGYGPGQVLVVVDEDGDGSIDQYAYFDGVKNINVNLQGGDDTFVGSAIDISGNLDVRLGDGDDQFALTNDFGAYGYGFDDNEIGKKLSISGGDGDDEIQVAGVVVGKDLSIDAGAGDDDVEIGHYADESFIYIVGYGDVAAYGDVEVGGNTKIRLGDGDDDLNIEPYDAYAVLFSRNLDIDAGSGDDYVEFGESGYDNVVTVEGRTNIRLGSGDDEMEFEYEAVLLAGDARFDGGPGYDVIDDLVYVEFGGDLKIKAFELF
jgi:hypothetical protein